MHPQQELLQSGVLEQDLEPQEFIDTDNHWKSQFFAVWAQTEPLRQENINMQHRMEVMQQKLMYDQQQLAESRILIENLTNKLQVVQDSVHHSDQTQDDELQTAKLRIHQLENDANLQTLSSLNDVEKGMYGILICSGLLCLALFMMICYFLSKSEKILRVKTEYDIKSALPQTKVKHKVNSNSIANAINLAGITFDNDMQQTRHIMDGESMEDQRTNINITKELSDELFDDKNDNYFKRDTSK